MPKSKPRKKAVAAKKAERRARAQVSRPELLDPYPPSVPAEPLPVSIPADAIPVDPDRHVGFGPITTFAGMPMAPEIIYRDDRVHALLTARGWISSRSGITFDGNGGDYWGFDTRGGDYTSPSRAFIHLTRDHIIAEPADGSGLDARSYTTVAELEADLDHIEAWPHEADLET